MKAVIFQHMSSSAPGTILSVLQNRGIEPRIIFTASEDISDFDPLAPDLLVVLGGAPGVYQSEEYPFLKDEAKVLEKRLAADKPTLGICLGAQLMAAALGQRVYRGDQGPEIGWHEIQLTEAGQSSMIAPYAKGRVMQWHNDTFDLPKEATLLASSEKFRHQIYSVGRNAMAFQCHIEVTSKILADWFVSGAGRFVENKEMLQSLRHDTDTYVPGMSKVTTSFLTDWLDQRLPMKEKAYA